MQNELSASHGEVFECHIPIFFGNSQRRLKAFLQVGGCILFGHSKGSRKSFASVREKTEEMSLRRIYFDPL